MSQRQWSVWGCSNRKGRCPKDTRVIEDVIVKNYFRRVAPESSDATQHWEDATRSVQSCCGLVEQD